MMKVMMTFFIAFGISIGVVKSLEPELIRDHPRPCDDPRLCDPYDPIGPITVPPLKTSVNCYRRLECVLRHPSSTRIPGLNQCGLYKTKSNPLICEAKRKHHQIYDIPAIGPNGGVKIISSPGILSVPPYDYDKNIFMNCSVQCPPGNVMFVKFDEFQLEGKYCVNGACADYVQIADGTPYCGYTMPPPFIHYNSSALVTFFSNWADRYDGFIATITCFPLIEEGGARSRISSTPDETILINYFTQQIVDGVRKKSSTLLPKLIPLDELEESEEDNHNYASPETNNQSPSDQTDDDTDRSNDDTDRSNDQRADQRADQRDDDADQRNEDADDTDQRDDEHSSPKLEHAIDSSFRPLQLKDTIDFEDSAIERAFVYRHDNLRDATGEPTSQKPATAVKAVLKTLVDALLGEVERSNPERLTRLEDRDIEELKTSLKELPTISTLKDHELELPSAAAVPSTQSPDRELPQLQQPDLRRQN